MTKATPQVVVKDGPNPNPVMSMIVPGRRALGEDWSKVNIFPDNDTGGFRSEREDTAAPVDGVPIFVPGLGNLSIEMADFILEAQRKEAAYRLKHPNKPDPSSDPERVSQMFWDYLEQKIRAYKGQSTFGPGGHTQREKAHHK